ncbi:ClpP/crotonase-like domain-containing protein [Scheffersomyces amazonensis]|uniref:ClpP/crotonase-like domain-containing protein n=1 Tax=Scheffersomyces amazonensis TaxID=1078765 RepID=UPI00315C5D4E
MLRSSIKPIVSFHSKVSLTRAYLNSTTRSMSSSSSTKGATSASASGKSEEVEEDVVLFKNENSARLIVLNRPRKLNSLNTEMINLITPRLIEYSKSTSNNVIILTSSLPKSLCAGGDVASCAIEILKDNPLYPSDFFQQEYNLNYLISTYPKPYVALMDGITMGGGVGLSVHAPFRVATQTTKLAMPEMDIGFFPDVGTTFFLPRLDDKIGYYYALSGDILSGLDAYFAGFATHYIKSENKEALIKRLSVLKPPVINNVKTTTNEILSNQQEYFALVNNAIEEFSETKLPEDYKFPLSPEDITIIKQAFSQPTIKDVFKFLEGRKDNFSKTLLEKLTNKPLSSLNIAYELLKLGEKNSIKSQFKQELIAATNIVNIPAKENDFVLGVSHKLIDKIKLPAYPTWHNGNVSETFIKSILKSSIKTTKSLSEPYIKSFFGVDFDQYPHHMGLPSNQQVADYITGNDGSGRSYLPTPNEVHKYFAKTTNNKLGVEAKINQILQVHGEASKYDNKYVSWKA